ncbi:hypothetical protein EJB05_01374, partial [Eragrostis curvula]
MVFDLEGAGPIAGLDYDDDHVLHAPSLRFAVAGNPFRNDGEDNRRLITAVDAALALRGGAAGGSPDVEALEINFVFSAGANLYVHLPPRGRYVYGHAHAADITSAHLATWLRFAARHVTGSFTLAVPVLPPGPEMKAVPEHMKKQRVVELPAAARAETMSLTFGLARLAVPVAVAGAGYHALGDLLLSRAHIEPGGADERNLSSLLSAAGCPRLRRLRLEYITGLAALRLDPAAAALEEVNLHYIGDLSSLELDAPGLRQLRVTTCFGMYDDNATARISAPNLELLACNTLCIPDRLLFFHGVGSVRSLEKICLSSRISHDDHCKDGAIWLLQHCTAADSLDISLSPGQMKEGLDTEETMSRVPQLDNITNLAIDVGPGKWHNLKATIADLITKCSRLERLSIGICSANDSCSKPRCFCNGKDVEKISMEHLREATITGYHSSKYHRSLVQFIMAGAPALEKVTLELYVGKELHEDIPCDRGRWAPSVIEHYPKGARTTVYEWTADKKREEEEEEGSDGFILSKF